MRKIVNDSNNNNDKLDDLQHHYFKSFESNCLFIVKTKSFSIRTSFANNIKK